MHNNVLSPFSRRNNVFSTTNKKNIKIQTFHLIYLFKRDSWHANQYAFIGKYFMTVLPRPFKVPWLSFVFLSLSPTSSLPLFACNSSELASNLRYNPLSWRLKRHDVRSTNILSPSTSYTSIYVTVNHALFIHIASYRAPWFHGLTVTIMLTLFWFH